MSDSEDDASFPVLPSRLRRRIDGAFNRVATQAGGGPDASAGPSPKKRKLNSGASTPAPGGFLAEGNPEPGGFIVDDDAGGFIREEPGGFIPESAGNSDGDDDDNSPSQSHHEHNHIPLTLVPTALQLLDLQPDDEDVFAVFRNAASGWEGRGAAKDDAHLVISRKDWRAVCAALLDTGGPDHDADDADMDDLGDGPNEDDSSEEYVESQDDEEPVDDGSDEEYQDGGFIRSKSARKTRGSKGKGRTRTAPRSSSPLGSDISEELSSAPRRITARQKAESRRAFAMLFSDVPDGDLDKQRIMIKDVARVAALLKEKLTAEEVRSPLSPLRCGLNDLGYDR